MVAANVRRLRKSLDLSLRELSSELADRSVVIASQSLSALERGQTGITVDLLTALAAVLGVNPDTLLLPHTSDAFEPAVELTGVSPTFPRSLHEWLSGQTPLDAPAAVEDRNPALIAAFRDRLIPEWRH